jgi:hypothetical protein
VRAVAKLPAVRGGDTTEGLVLAAPDSTWLVLAEGGLSTTGLQGWITDNVVPLILLGIAVILLWIGGRGDNAGVARRSVGLIIGLVALGIAVSGNGPEIGSFLAGLLTG